MENFYTLVVIFQKMSEMFDNLTIPEDGAV